MAKFDLPTNYDKLKPWQRRLVREEYIKLQEGKCHHCGASLSQDPSEEILNKRIKAALFPPGFFKYPVHLHHNHHTGMTIGAVHSWCNAVLWQYHGE